MDDLSGSGVTGLSEQEILQNHERLVQRDGFFLQFGYDMAASIEFVLEQALPLAEPVLEFATGKGRFVSRLAARVPRVTSVELDSAEQRIAMLNAAHAGVLQKIEFVAADAARLTWPDGHFGSVVSMNTMHHITPVTAVLEELVRVTRPDGKTVISDFDEKGFAIMDRIHASEGGTHSRSSCTTEQLVSFFEGIGWQVRCVSGALQTVVIATGAA